LQAAVVSLVSVAAAVYVGLGLLLYAAQRSILYYPTPDVGAFGAETLRVDNANETLKVLRLNGGNARAIIYFGGNAEAVAVNIPAFGRIFADATVYLVNYRGYGGSSGAPTEQALYADAAAVYDYVARLHEHIAVVGRSLGAGVATYLASVRDVERLVLVTPFDSMENVAAGHYPIFPVALLLKDKFRAIDHVARVVAPTLVVMAEHDQVIPRRHTESLIAAFGEHDLTAVTLHGTDHNTIDNSPHYARLLQEFL
jgi:pimeloyl-ACP methyl ester carboxylesterase